MGFYQPAQLVIDAKKHGVEFLPADVNHSEWDYTLEKKSAKYWVLRMGFRQIKGLRQEEILLLIAGREKPYTHIHALLDAGLSQTTLEKLADANAFRSLGLDRREALWEVSALADRPIGLFAGQPSESSTEKGISLPRMTDSEQVVDDYSTMSLSLGAHPISFLRQKLNLLGNLPSKELPTRRNGELVRVAGLVLVRQRPGTAKGTCFITLEDETGNFNLILWASLFDEYRKEILNAKLLMVEGNLQIEQEVVHVIVQRCFNISRLLADLTPCRNEDLPLLTLSRADEKSGPFLDDRIKPQESDSKGNEMFPKGRNFK
jgi:error-prone DNA polymerase